MPIWRDRGSGMEVSQRQRFRDFVALATPTLFLVGLLFVIIAQGGGVPALIVIGGFAAFFGRMTYRSRPRPMDQRVLKPIVTGGLILLATFLAVRIVEDLVGNPYFGLIVGAVGIAIVVVVVRFQVLKIIGPKTPDQLETRSSKTK